MPDKTLTAIFLCIGEISNCFAVNLDGKGTSANESTLFIKVESVKQHLDIGHKYRLTYRLTSRLDNREIEIESVEQVD